MFPYGATLWIPAFEIVEMSTTGNGRTFPRLCGDSCIILTPVE